MKAIVDAETEDKVKRTTLASLSILSGLVHVETADSELPQNLNHLPATSLIRHLFSHLQSCIQTQDPTPIVPLLRSFTNVRY